METQSNSDGKNCGSEEGGRPASSAETPDMGKSEIKVDRALQALEGIKDVYAQELSTLRALNEAISTKQAFQVVEGSSRQSKPSCPPLLEKLLQERDSLCEELQRQQNRCDELQRQLEQEHAEKLEAQTCISILNETVMAALQGKKFLAEQNQHLVSDHQVLARKLQETSKMRLSGFYLQIKELESVCNSMKQKEVVLLLYTKVCIHGLWVCVQLVLFCHAMIWFLLKVLKDYNYGFAPT